ncbi:MAG TPA: hypothetical protein PLA88_07365 [Bacteroidales bacterium]|nr:hypothetical protein [Bacteroidales bacterium]
MKRILLLSLIFSALSFFSAKAQNNVGIGTTSPAASALLDLTATDKGLLIPRVTLVAAANGTTPVAAPATGLLVFNTGGAMTSGFYYWDGSQWVQVGAASAPTCVTLDGAYDCGGSGAGRSVTVDAGRIEFTIPSGATNNEGLYIVSNKGTSGVPTACSWLVQNQWGVGLQVDNNLGANEYSAVQGATYTSQSSTTYFPAGIAGYASGTGKAVGVWAQYDGSNTGGAGLYAKSSGNNFGARMVGDVYPGAYIQTNSASSQAFQAASASASFTNPCGLLVGSVQFDISSNATCQSVIFNNLAGEPTLAPEVADYGMVGTAGMYWYQGYAEAWNALSRPELKRNITQIDENISALIMNDIKNINPVFYKFNDEKDQLHQGSENKTRYNMHLGLLITNAPDYIQDNTFNAIDIYALSTLSLMGTKINTEQIEQVTNNVNTLSKNASISDFGFQSSGESKEIRVDYSTDFCNQLPAGYIPVVNITPASPDAEYYIKSQDSKGFVVVSNKTRFDFNWIAMAKIKINEIEQPDASNVNDIDAEFMSQIRVSQDKKAQMKSWGLKPQQQPMQLLGPTDTKETNTRN